MVIRNRGGPEMGGTVSYDVLDTVFSQWYMNSDCTDVFGVHHDASCAHAKEALNGSQKGTEHT